MLFVLTRKGASSCNKHHFLFRAFNLCFKSLTAIPSKDNEAAPSSVPMPPSDNSSSLHLSPFFSDFSHPSTGFDIELVDHDAWAVSSGLAQAWRGPASKVSSCGPQVTDEALDDLVEDELDFEDIDNMRVRGNLFYKLERSSKEFEEYNLDFQWKKKSSKKKEEVNKAKEELNNAKTTPNVTSKVNKHPKVDDLTKIKSAVPHVDEINDGSPLNKRQRTPTFNQLTGPYHEPLSKVVVVAHSISKDFKFDLASTKNKTTCAAVGAILAQRALADDIHDVVYTPRKGEKVEGKLQIVLQSIINNGINVKLLLKIPPHCSYPVACLWEILLVLSKVLMCLSKEFIYMNCQGLETWGNLRTL